MLQDIGRRYVRVINDVRDRTGTLWEGRFKSNLIDSENYLLTCHRYIELNPVRAGMATSPAGYPWTSHSHYAHGKPNRLISEHPVYVGLGATGESRRLRFLSLFETPLEECDLSRLRISVNKGWALGSDKFLDRMEAVLGRSVRPARRGRPQKNNAESNEDENPQAEMLL